jgi:hypothetical protein
MISSTKRFLSGAISFLVLLKTLSHSADIAGIARVILLALHLQPFGSSLAGCSDVCSDPYTLKAFRLTF